MDKQQILDEAIEHASPPRIRANEFTVVQFVDRHRVLYGPLSTAQGRRRLKRSVEAGIMGVRKVLLDGYTTNAYHTIREGENEQARRSHKVSETTGESV